MISIFGAMITDVGMLREQNEDCVLFSLPSDGPESSTRVPFAVVADGMGGHQGGEVASALAVEITRQIMESGRWDVVTSVKQSLQVANRAIFSHAASSPDLEGMGTTCTILAFSPNGCVLGHIGDSRAYRFRNSELTQLTQDHTLEQALMDSGIVSDETENASKYGHVLTKSLGTSAQVEPDFWVDEAPPALNDVYLLCSDGLHGLMKDDEIASLLVEKNPRAACDRLVEAANSAGGRDNVSVGVFHIVDV